MIAASLNFSDTLRITQALREFTPLAFRYQIQRMATVDQIRRANLAILFSEYGSWRALADVVGVSESQLSQWANGSPDSKTGKPRGMRPESCRRIEAATGKPDGWMDQDHATPGGSPEQSNVHEIYARKRVPIISWVVAGQLEEIEDNNYPGEAEEWIDVYDTKPGEQAFALRVDGDSMTSPHPGERTFPEGTVIVVDPLRGATAGDFVVAKDVITQKATFKKLTTDGGRWFLKPLNPAYPTVEIDDPALRVIGRVIESMTRQKL